jgi:hypothetical protein
MTKPSMARDLFLGKSVRAEKNCTYCGSVWDLGRDHVIPTSYLRTKRAFRGDWCVPCCSECNSLLGAELLFNVPDRAAWVHELINRKYRTLLCSLQWDQDEIDELGYNLKIVVEGEKARRAEMLRRLAHLEIVAAMDPTYMSDDRPSIFLQDEECAEFIEDDSVAARERRDELLRRARKKYR